MIHYKRFSILWSIVFGLFLSVTAHPIDLETARDIAVKFMGTDDLLLSATYFSERHAAFHVFNTENGFIIVAADDSVTPIIGYSHEGRFDPDNVPAPLEEYLREIVIGPTTCKESSNKAVGPLLSEKWHQGCLYNNHCPAYPSAPCGHAEVGCAAVAMGQIMHYWGYPSTGWGSHSYTNSGTTLSADFGNTTYLWDRMPNLLDETSGEDAAEAVSTLLYHCGVSINMKYAASGSYAYATDVPDALVRYFDFSRRIRLEMRDDYDDNAWASLLKENLDRQQPILYAGFGSAGHAFVCDGYDSNNLFHFNWGWGGNADGYFSLGNLNPNGYNFSTNNYAILDIYPQYDPCLVDATAFPSQAGIVEGAGEYHFGTKCTLTATASEGYDFLYWEKDGAILSNAYTLTLNVNDDIPNIVAHFTCFPVSEIKASYHPDESNPSSPDLRLSWTHPDNEWTLIKQFPIQGETGGMASDGEYIYLTYASWNNPTFAFEKYTMDGAWVESFNLDSVPDAFCLDFDGTGFYCNGFNTGHLSVLYHIDLDHKTVIDSTEMDTWFAILTYDPEYDGFWLGHDYNTILCNRQGDKVKTSPTIQEYLYGTVFLTDKDGNSHLLFLQEHGIYDYNLRDNVVKERPVMTWGDHTVGYGAFKADYNGKDAMVFSMDSTVYIYEINSILEDITQTVHYRIYRSDNEGHTVRIADEVGGLSYIDTTWNNLNNGLYRYGISSVFTDGSESEAVWSEPIAKTNHGIGELDDPTCPKVRKVVEDNRLFILVNGKKYTVTGQEIQ